MKLVDSREAAAILGVSASTVVDLARKGIVQAYQIGPAWTYDMGSVQQAKQDHFADGWTATEVAARYGKDRRNVTSLLRRIKPVGLDRRRGGAKVYAVEAIERLAAAMGWSQSPPGGK